MAQSQAVRRIGFALGYDMRQLLPGPEGSSGEEAFTAFVAARSAALGRTAYLLTGNRHDAEDLVQSSLFKAAKHWRRIQHNPEAYVRRILYNENISAWRRRQVRRRSY